MAGSWILFLLVGLASSVLALDADYAADKVTSSLDATLKVHASQWFRLPGFNISFNNRNESEWHVLYGELESIGGAERDQNVEPLIAHYTRDSSSVVIPVNIKDFVVRYNFTCSDFFGISGYSYSISRTVSTHAIIIVDIIPESPSQCRGELHSTTCSEFSFEEDGSDFTEITPNDQYAKQCIKRSYTNRKDYADIINEQFDKVYGDAVEKMLSSASQIVLRNLNLCSQ